MTRTQTLTLRLTPDELALLATLRQAGYFPASQADIVFWALEDMCKRILGGDNCGFNLRPEARDLCQQALDRYYSGRRRDSYRGSPPRLTARDQRLTAAGPAPGGGVPLTP